MIPTQRNCENINNLIPQSGTKARRLAKNSYFVFFPPSATLRFCVKCFLVVGNCFTPSVHRDTQAAFGLGAACDATDTLASPSELSNSRGCIVKTLMHDLGYR